MDAYLRPLISSCLHATIFRQKKKDLEEIEKIEKKKKKNTVKIFIYIYIYIYIERERERGSGLFNILCLFEELWELRFFFILEYPQQLLENFTFLKCFQCNY